jgi:hypothetical protein
MPVDAMIAMKALHRALTFGKDIRKIDRLFGQYSHAMERANRENPTKKLKEEAKIAGTKLNQRLNTFESSIKRFVSIHHVSPVLSSDLPDICVGFTKSGRWGTVDGNDEITLRYPKWFQVLDLPVPKKACEVFG